LKNKTVVVDKNGNERELVAKVIKEEYIVKNDDGQLTTLDEGLVKKVYTKRVPDNENKGRVKTSVSISSKKREQETIEKRVQKLENAVGSMIDRLTEIISLLD